MTNNPLGGYSDDVEGWAWFMARLHADGPRGPQCAEVVRRFVAGEIEVPSGGVGRGGVTLRNICPHC